MKYIDAEKLIAEIERRKKAIHSTMFNDEYNDLLNFVHSLQQERPEPTCKSCGFYENNCPFIRNTFKPYPNRACKDYTYSVMKEQEQPSLPSNLDEAAEEYEHNLGLFEHINLWPITAFKAGAEWMAGQISKAE